MIRGILYALPFALALAWACAPPAPVVPLPPAAAPAPEEALAAPGRPPCSIRQILGAEPGKDVTLRAADVDRLNRCLAAYRAAWPRCREEGR